MGCYPQTTIFLVWTTILLVSLVHAMPARLSNNKDDNAADVAGLKALLEACKTEQQSCVPGGRIDSLAEQQFRKAGFRRIETLFLMKILRSCLDNMDDCDPTKAMKVMEDMEESARRHKLNRAVGSKSLSTSIVVDLKTFYPELLSGRSSPVFGRHGRKYLRSSRRAAAPRARRSLNVRVGKSRQKRSLLASIFYNMARETHNGTPVDNSLDGNGAVPKDADE